MDLKTRREMRFDQVRRVLESDMTASEWCRLNKVAESTLYLWMSKYRNGELEHDLSTAQKHKETMGWIELTRSGLASELAIAPVPAGNGEAGVVFDGMQQVRPIAVSLGGAVVSIPSGSAPGDIEAVLRTVSAL